MRVLRAAPLAGVGSAHGFEFKVDKERIKKLQNVLITGSSRGIGFAIAKEFCECGKNTYNVVLNGKTDKLQLDNAAKLLNCSGFLADISDYEQTKLLFAKIEQKIGNVDILVNNAGLAHFGLFTDTTPSDWQNILQNNLNTVLNATHLAVPHMVKAKKGVIINITSIWGNVGASCEAVYSAAKGAVNAFTKAMAQELGPSGVRVCAVACGAIATRMNQRLTAAEQAEFTDKIALMRFGEPHEVAKLAKFLASDAAGYITGQIINLDGGT
ncbi:MAG: SDR family oxidoreductase [Defluviitaleaceae bacterium]|nr:SDR family oxidoreductase [Defluviitaleaceae bacterium]